MMAHRPRKRFGQHFLHDPHVIARTVESLNPRPQDTVVEIGPGKGVLTRALIGRAGHVHAVELDRDLIAYLREHFSASEATVHEADALRFDFCQLARNDEKLRLVGNLPYNISTPLLFHLIKQLGCIADMHFMLQKEVVNRLGASPGGKDYGRLSVMVQWHCEVAPLFDVAPGAFAPPPKVRSAVVRLKPRATPLATINDPAVFERVVRTAFSHRRKTLRNALREVADETQLRAAEVDPEVRPERLTVAQFAAIANQVA